MLDDAACEVLPLKVFQFSRKLLLGVKPMWIRARSPNVVSKNLARIVRVSFDQRFNAERPCDSHCLALLHEEQRPRVPGSLA